MRDWKRHQKRMRRRRHARRHFGSRLTLVVQVPGKVERVLNVISFVEVPSQVSAELGRLIERTERELTLLVLGRSL
jgi:hypothetical protein